MFRRKFIDRLREKYQTGGELATTYGGKAAHLLEGIGHVAPKIAGTAGRFAGAAGIPLMLGDFYQRGQRLSGGKVNVNQEPFLQNSIANNESIWKKQKGGIREPYLSIGGRSINTDNGTRYGAGAKLSAPILESIRRGSDASGLRFETDFAGTNSGPVSISNDERGKAYNASIGLRGYHNKYINRNNTLSLNSNIGAGIGTGDENGDGEMNPFVDANLSLLKSGRTRKGTAVSVGPTLSYGTEGSPNQGLQLGLEGNYGRLSGNVGYDITNKSPKIGASLNFKEGGMYNQMQQYQMGGQQLPGGEMEPIPGSDAVQFNGQSHDQGGIMVDGQTEVEGGETMDQVTMAKNGGKRSDYFFSDHLKEGGVSYANMHKEILAEGGDQEKIDWLAQMQERAAGRSPGKIQTAESGGTRKYQGGSFLEREPVGPVATITEPNIYQDDEVIIGEDGLETYITPGQLTADLIEGDFSQLKSNKKVQKSGEKTLEQMKKDEESAYQELLKKARKKGVNGSDAPLLSYGAGLAQLGSAAYSYFHKQPDAEQATYTQGFTSPIIAERGKSSKLERVNYNNERSTNASDMRGLNRFIETSGGGPANIINKMMAYSQKQKGDSKINAAETRVNSQIANQEAQLEQQMAVNNMTRAQQASTTNAQLSRAEAARMDQINANNATARQKVKDDQEFMKYQGIAQAADGLAGIAGDVLSYKGQERLARALGSNGVYDRDKLMTYFLKTKNPLTDKKYTFEEAKEATRAVYNKNNPNENS